MATTPASPADPATCCTRFGWATCDLLRLRQTANVQRLVKRQFERQDWSRPDSQGCQVVEDHLQLLGWSKKRRVVVVRQRIKGGIARERRVDGKQLKLDLVGASVHDGQRL